MVGFSSPESSSHFLGDITKKKDIYGFYRNLDKNVAFGGRKEEDEEEAPKREKSKSRSMFFPSDFVADIGRSKSQSWIEGGTKKKKN